MRRNDFLTGAAMAGLGIMYAADTGAPVGGGAVLTATAGETVTTPAPTAATPAPTAATTETPAPRVPREATKGFDSLDALKAAPLSKGYRRYHITVPGAGNVAARELFCTAREPDKALAFASETLGVKVVNIDNPMGGPGRKPAKSIDEMLENMTPEARAALLAKYLGGGTTPAATTPAATTPTPPRDGNATATTNAAAAPRGGGSPVRNKAATAGAR